MRSTVSLHQGENLEYNWRRIVKDSEGNPQRHRRRFYQEEVEGSRSGTSHLQTEIEDVA